MLTQAGILAAVYVIVMPIVLRLAAVVHKKMVTDRLIEKAGKNSAALDKIKPPIWNQWRERLSYLIKEDKRLASFGSKKKDDKEEPPESGITNKQVFFLILLVGLGCFVSPSFGTSWWMLAAGSLLFFVGVSVGMSMAKPVVEARKSTLDRMFEIASKRLGQSLEFKKNPGEVIKVLKWENEIDAVRIQFNVPDNFDHEMGGEGFLRQLNQIFGQVRTFVPDDSDPEHPGWDRSKGVLTIYAVPPLPQIAHWSAHYIDTPGVAPSFFPIGLTVSQKASLAIPNPETGEVEHVVGFDLAGEQKDYAKKHGLEFDDNIASASPMVLIAGSTGGGKAMASDTLVIVRVRRKK